ncbi:MAG: hypothetical protein JKY65_25970 [Planctomycetes bacterium]|nr:hypothetical protein [Planctomycetota bacterium]
MIDLPLAAKAAWPNGIGLSVVGTVGLQGVVAGRIEQRLRRHLEGEDLVHQALWQAEFMEAAASCDSAAPAVEVTLNETTKRGPRGAGRLVVVIEVVARVTGLPMSPPARPRARRLTQRLLRYLRETVNVHFDPNVIRLLDQEA